MFLPIGEFAPDQMAAGYQGATVAKNCVPSTKDGYGPFPSLVTLTTALTATCQGAIAVRANDGNVYIFAGDATKLYQLSGSTWTDVSKAGGYSTPSDGAWFFVQIGNRIVATNYFDAIQTFVIGVSSLFADLSASAPKARYVAVVRGALVVASTNDGVDGEVQNRVWWPDVSDPTSWPTIGSAAAAAAQSDYNDIAYGGGIFGILGGVGGRDGVVWLQNAIVVMTYSGPPTVFSFQDAERGRGTTIAGSIINAGLFAAYIGEDGFYLFNGVSSVAIGSQKVDVFFWDGANQLTLNLIRSAVHPKRKLLLWSYATGSSTTPDRILIFNWELGRWSYADASTEIIVSGYTSGFDLDTDSSYANDTNLDSTAPGLDSTAFMGGRVLMGGFDSNHKFGFFDGDTLTATMETGEPLNSTGRRYEVDGILPVTDAATKTAAVGYRDDLDDAITYTTATSPQADRFCPQRIETPLPRVRITIAAAQSWTHCKGAVLRMNEGSER